MSERPWFVVRSADVSERENVYPPPFDLEKLGHRRDLASAAGSRSLGVVRERLAPGRRTSLLHAHLREEEAVYVLSGRPTLRWTEPGTPTRSCELAPGDLAVFPAGTGIAHQIVNPGRDDVEILVVGERRTGDKVAYPDDPAYMAWREEHDALHAWRDLASPLGEGRGAATRIETPRLVLRPWAYEDVIDLVEVQARNQAHLVRFMPWAAALPTPDEMADRIAGWSRSHHAGGDQVFGVFTPEGEIVGGTGFHDRIGVLGREIGYWIAKDHEGKGLVTEWVGALVRVGFLTMDLDRIEIHCAPANVRSAAVPRRLGFTLEATLPRRNVGTDGKPEDSLIFTLYDSQWAASPAAEIPVKAWDRLGRRLV